MLFQALWEIPPGPSFLTVFYRLLKETKRVSNYSCSSQWTLSIGELQNVCCWNMSNPKLCTKHRQIEQGAQDCVQGDFEYLQQWKVHNLTHNKSCLYGQMKFIEFQFVPIASYSVHYGEESGLTFFIPFCLPG